LKIGIDKNSILAINLLNFCIIMKKMNN
jgi:hypothetical protein